MAPPEMENPVSYTTLSTTGKQTRRKSRRRSSLSGQKPSDKRERHRERAKRAHARKKYLLESLQQSVSVLQEENQKLKESLRNHLGEDDAAKVLSSSLPSSGEATKISTNVSAAKKDLMVKFGADKVLDDTDSDFIKALQTAQQNFCVTDPSFPDNPIVYATQGFLNLTGYTLDQVLGRNCRFLQGPKTDPSAVDKIRKAIEAGSDMSICLLNYRADGTTFWNQFFIAALRDAAGNVTNYVGVQCKVSDDYAANVCKKQSEGVEDDANDEEDDKEDEISEIKSSKVSEENDDAEKESIKEEAEEKQMDKKEDNDVDNKVDKTEENKDSTDDKKQIDVKTEKAKVEVNFMVDDKKNGVESKEKSTSNENDGVSDKNCMGGLTNYFKRFSRMIKKAF